MVVNQTSEAQSEVPGTSENEGPTWWFSESAFLAAYSYCWPYVWINVGQLILGLFPSFWCFLRDLGNPQGAPGVLARRHPMFSRTTRDFSNKTQSKIL